METRGDSLPSCLLWVRGHAWLSPVLKEVQVVCVSLAVQPWDNPSSYPSIFSPPLVVAQRAIVVQVLSHMHWGDFHKLLIPIHLRIYWPFLFLFKYKEYPFTLRLPTSVFGFRWIFTYATAQNNRVMCVCTQSVLSHIGVDFMSERQKIEKKISYKSFEKNSLPTGWFFWKTKNRPKA